MFDFYKRNSSGCSRNPEDWDDSEWSELKNFTVKDYAAAVLKDDPEEELPEKVTICSSIYIDLEDCDTNSAGGDNWRVYPVWAFADENGKVNLTLRVASKSLQHHDIIMGTKNSKDSGSGLEDSRWHLIGSLGKQLFE